jgi:hypothetical protein
MSLRQCNIRYDSRQVLVNLVDFGVSLILVPRGVHLTACPGAGAIYFDEKLCGSRFRRKRAITWDDVA